RLAVVNNIAPSAYAPKAATASAGKCSSTVGPISERETFTSWGKAKPATTAIAPIALDKMITHGRIDCPYRCSGSLSRPIQLLIPTLRSRVAVAARPAFRVRIARESAVCSSHRNNSRQILWAPLCLVELKKLFIKIAPGERGVDQEVK